MDEAEASDGFSEWEQIQAMTHSTPPMTQSGEKHDMVATNEYNIPQHQHDLSVFPPSRHEGLDIKSDEEEEVHNSDEANSGPLKKASAIGKLLTNGIVKVTSRVRYYMDFGWGVWSVGAVNGIVAALLLSLVYAKVKRWRGRVKEEKKDRLIFLIQEKDQKINQLLVQIGHMNELLSAKRSVPVVRVS